MACEVIDLWRHFRAWIPSRHRWVCLEASLRSKMTWNTLAGISRQWLFIGSPTRMTSDKLSWLEIDQVIIWADGLSLTYIWHIFFSFLVFILLPNAFFNAFCIWIPIWHSKVRSLTWPLETGEGQLAGEFPCLWLERRYSFCNVGCVRNFVCGL